MERFRLDGVLIMDVPTSALMFLPELSRHVALLPPGLSAVVSGMVLMVVWRLWRDSVWTVYSLWMFCASCLRLCMTARQEVPLIGFNTPPASQLSLGRVSGTSCRAVMWSVGHGHGMCCACVCMCVCGCVCVLIYSCVDYTDTHVPFPPFFIFFPFLPPPSLPLPGC